jgi:hypothetical protein
LKGQPVRRHEGQPVRFARHFFVGVVLRPVFTP